MTRNTITLPRSVVEQALEAWEQARGALAYVAVGNAPSNPNLARSTCSQAVWVLDNAEPALRAALEQPQVEQEPVAWLREDGKLALNDGGMFSGNWKPLYTQPQPKREPLTDEEIKMLIPDGDGWKYEVGFAEATEFARAIERAHGIGGEA